MRQLRGNTGEFVARLVLISIRIPCKTSKTMNLNNFRISRRLAIVGTLTMLMSVLLALGPNMHLSVLEQRANNIPQSAAALEEIAQAARTVTAMVILGSATFVL